MSTRVVAIAWLVITAAAAAWALRPLEAQPVHPLAAPAATWAGSGASPPALDLDAFRTPLWTAPPPPPAPTAAPPPPPPPPPTKLILLAITTAPDGVARATLYDPGADRVETLAAGELCGTATIDAVTSHEVTITDAAGTRTLILRPDQTVPAGKGGGP